MTNRLSSLLGHLSSLARDLPESCKINGLDVSMEDGGEISATVVISSVNDDQQEPSGEALGYDFGTVPAGDHSAKVTSVERGDQGRLIVGIDIGGQITKSVVNEPAPLPDADAAAASVGKLQGEKVPTLRYAKPRNATQAAPHPMFTAFKMHQDMKRDDQQAPLPGVLGGDTGLQRELRAQSDAIAESAADRLRNWRRDASNIMAQMREEVGDDNPVYTDEEASLIALLDEVNTDIAARRRDAKAWRQHADNLEERLATAQRQAETAREWAGSAESQAKAMEEKLNAAEERAFSASCRAVKAEGQVSELERKLSDADRLQASYVNTVDDLGRRLHQAMRDLQVLQQAASQAQGDAVPQGWQEVQS